MKKKSKGKVISDETLKVATETLAILYACDMVKKAIMLGNEVQITIKPKEER